MQGLIRVVPSKQILVERRVGLSYYYVQRGLGRRSLPGLGGADPMAQGLFYPDFSGRPHNLRTRFQKAQGMVFSPRRATGYFQPHVMLVNIANWSEAVARNDRQKTCCTKFQPHGLTTEDAFP